MFLVTAAVDGGGDDVGCAEFAAIFAATKIAGMNESVLRAARGRTAVRPKTVQGRPSDSERIIFSSDVA
jgi:hypothetical protein